MNAHWAALNPPGMARKEAEALEGLTLQLPSSHCQVSQLATGSQVSHLAWLLKSWGGRPGRSNPAVQGAQVSSSCPREIPGHKEVFYGKACGDSESG
jgi:hypothetical protein